jgi:serine/threonine protein kinase
MIQDSKITNQEKTKTSMDMHQLLQSLTTHCSDAAIDLLTRLLHPIPQHRLSAVEALDHSWIKSRVQLT